ncbi:cytochrome C, partial [Mesorhizobium sp. M4A.F.Ca.ET.029.04.2.1]
MPWLRKLVGAALVLGGVGAVAGWVLSAPVRLDAATVAQLGPGDAARGKRIFYAGGCTSCHAKPGSQGDDRLALTGGLELKTPFGTFVPPNISQDAKDGIGAW